MAVDLARHDAEVSQAIDDYDGEVISRAGDSFVGAFAEADDAVAAAVAVQQAVSATEWTLTGGIRVRMGVHRGRAQRRGDSWYGLSLSEAARHDGDCARRPDPRLAGRSPRSSEGVELLDLGEHRLRDIDDEHRLYQVMGAGLTGDFPPLRSMASA